MSTKILHIGQLIGGLDVYIRNVVQNADSDFEFVVIHGPDDNNETITNSSHRVKCYSVPMYRKLSFMNDVKALWQMLKIIRREKPDVIHCHSAKGGTLGRIAGFLTGVRTLYTPHAFSFLSTPNKIVRSIYLMIERATSFNSYLLACSESECQIGLKQVKYDNAHALVWHNAIPCVEERCDSPIPAKGKYVCYMARPCYQKNPFFLVKVIKAVHERMPELGFCLLGVGFHSPNANDLKTEIDKAGVGDCVTVFPWLSHEECLNYIRGAELYFSVSRYEGMSLSVLEAMSLGKAIVASNVFGNCDCIDNGRNGYLLPFDANLFADAIIQLVQDDDLRHSFEQESRKIFLQRFSIDRCISSLNDIYHTNAF
jgi:glycosyltransferase involved in cell wall biosynthesis